MRVKKKKTVLSKEKSKTAQKSLPPLKRRAYAESTDDESVKANGTRKTVA